MGAVAANLLAPSGLRIGIFETAPHIYDKPRAVIVDNESLRTLQMCRLPGELLDFFFPYRGAHYLGVDGDIIRRFYAKPGPALLGWPSSATFIQPEVEDLLRRGVDQHANVEVFLEHEIVDVEPRESGATLRIKDHRGGQNTHCEARYVLGCDGTRSTVRTEIGGGFEDLAFDEQWLVVSVLLTRPVPLPEFSIAHCQPERPAMFVLGPRNLRRWELKLLPGETPDMFATDGDVKEVLGRFVDVDAIQIWRSSVYRFHAVVADRWRKGGMFILGDAAHQNPPFGGQGLCSGIRDVANLVWKIRQVEEFGAQPTLLDSYEVERKPNIRTIASRSRDIGKIVGEIDVAAATERDRRMRDEMKTTPEVYRQDVVPPLEAGIVARNTDGSVAARAGSLFIQPRVRRGTDASSHLLEDVLGSCFLFITDSASALDWFDDEVGYIWDKLGGEKVVISDDWPDVDDARAIYLSETDGFFAEWLSASKSAAVIIRPDRYVYGVAADRGELQVLVRNVGDALYDTP